METFKDYTITLDDDPMIYKMIERLTGSTSLPFTQAQMLLKKAASYRPKTVFVDVDLAGETNGLDIIPELRQIWPDIPILVITGDTDNSILAQAFASGATDFIRKPLQQNELLPRYQARILECQQRKQMEEMKIGNCILRFSNRALSCGEKTVYLSQSSTKILTVLAAAKGEIVTKKCLMRFLWGNIHIADNTLDRRISELRSRLRELECNLSVQCLYGKGIVLSHKEPVEMSENLKVE